MESAESESAPIAVQDAEETVPSSRPAEPQREPAQADATAVAKAAFEMGEQIAQQMQQLAVYTVSSASAGQPQGQTTVSGGPDDNSVRIFIGDVSPLTTHYSLTAHFQQFGPVLHATVKHPIPGSSERTRSFAFISVPDMATAQAILAVPHVVDGHRVGVPELAKHRQGERRAAAGATASIRASTAGWDAQPTKGGGKAPPETRKIFLGGLSHATKDAALTAYFSQFGAISDVVVMTEGNQKRPRGFGFVTFESAASVDVVTRNRFHPIDGRLVEVKAAIPREQMRSLHAAGEPAPPGEGREADGDARVAGAAPTGGIVGSDGYALLASHAEPAAPSGQDEWYAGTNMAYNAYGMMVPHGVPVFNGYAPQPYGLMPPAHMMAPPGSPTAAPPIAASAHAGAPPMASPAAMAMPAAAQAASVGAAVLPLSTNAAMPAPILPAAPSAVAPVAAIGPANFPFTAGGAVMPPGAAILPGPAMHAGGWPGWQPPGAAGAMGLLPAHAPPMGSLPMGAGMAPLPGCMSAQQVAAGGPMARPLAGAAPPVSTRQGGGHAKGKKSRAAAEAAASMAAQTTASAVTASPAPPRAAPAPAPATPAPAPAPAAPAPAKESVPTPAAPVPAEESAGAKEVQ